MSFTLYRFYAADDALLYVGLSVNPGKRFERHKADKEWWPEVARVELEQYPDHPTLRAAEREAITEERPRYNIRMNERRPSDGLVWRCEVCRNPIADEEGYITISYADLDDHRLATEKANAWKAAEIERTGSTWIATPITLYPDYVRWRILHGTCDPQPQSSDYWIGVERVRTPRALLGWTAHLLEKGWLRHTSWAYILRSQVGDEDWA